MDKYIPHIQIRMSVVRLMFFLSLFQVTSSGSGQHSLWVLASYISGQTPFPEYTAVVLLDDLQVAYFDSESSRLMRASEGGGGGAEKGTELDLGQEAVWILQEMHFDMRIRLTLFKQRFNLTGAPGVHVQQRLTGCEVLQDGQPALIMFRDGTNGEDADSLMYNTTHFTYACNQLGMEWGTAKRLHFQVIYSDIFLPLCVRVLRRHLDREKHQVRRRVRPRVRFMTKRVAGGRARLTCLATDFYPRHINLTLLRDGRPVDDEEEELTGGSALPNGNGLYQARKTLTVDEKELRENKHGYTCTASHLSLDNKLEVSWRAEFSRSHRIHVVSAPVGLALGLALLLGLVRCWRRWRQRREGSVNVPVETQEMQKTTTEGVDRQTEHAEEPMMNTDQS